MKFIYLKVYGTLYQSQPACGVRCPCPLRDGRALGSEPTHAVGRAYACEWLYILYFLINFMGKIDENIIRGIIDRADIVDVVSDFIKLRKTGARYTALCPFHEDRHDGNFIVYPKGNCYRCFTCDAKGGPVEFLLKHGKMSFPDAIRWLGKKYNIDVDDLPLDYTPPPPRPTPPPLPKLELPKEWVRRTMSMKSTLTEWLPTIPWDSAQRHRINEALWLYCVGGWKDGRTVFWMIDDQGVPRSAKLMQYLQNGHRDKEAHPGWIYNQDGCRQICNPDDHEIVKPLFGMHLLNRYPNATVHIVESEKTAVLMAIAYGNHATQVWMACGGAENLNREKLSPIIKQDRRIILYPDRDAIDRWKLKAEQLRYDRELVDTAPVTKWWKPEDGEKADIADVVIRMTIENANQPHTNIDTIMQDHPALKTLVDKLNLEENENKKI